MLTLGTPLSHSATKLMLLGSGELGKELAIEAQRLGLEIIALDRYDDAPAMQVAHRQYVVSMLDGKALADIIEAEKPKFIVPELEAIATNTLSELSEQGYQVTPSAKAVSLTLDREGIRRFASEQLKLQTPPYAFATTRQEFDAALNQIGLPCVVKPIMSSSGKGQAIVKEASDADEAWLTAQSGGRAGPGKVILEGFIDFDYEVTLLTVSHKEGMSFCAPIAHVQKGGDYIESWQPHPMHEATLKNAQDIAAKIVKGLGGLGLFGVELFVKGDTIYFSEVSPRPHDTGMVTMISQNVSQFALHLRALLGLPIPPIIQRGPAASRALIAVGDSNQITTTGIEKALKVAPESDIRLFGKPMVQGKRRLGVALARADTIKAARAAVEKMDMAINFS